MTFKGQYVSFPGKNVINPGQFVIIFRFVVIYIVMFFIYFKMAAAGQSARPWRHGVGRSSPPHPASGPRRGLIRVPSPLRGP